LKDWRWVKRVGSRTESERSTSCRGSECQKCSFREGTRLKRWECTEKKGRRRKDRARKAHLQPVMHPYERRRDVSRYLLLNEGGEASEALQLRRENVEERGGEDVLSLHVRDLRIDRRRVSVFCGVCRSRKRVNKREREYESGRRANRVDAKRTPQGNARASPRPPCPETPCPSPAYGRCRF
jgi:hypothetical protein